jgi:hypothetical protein
MSSRYLTIPTQKIEDGRTIISQTYYPEIGFNEDDVYIITSYNDRLDLIAYDFWGDESFWWVVAMVNNLECDSFFPPIGIQLRIPKDITSIINTFNKENEI